MLNAADENILQQWKDHAHVVVEHLWTTHKVCSEDWRVHTYKVYARNCNCKIVGQSIVMIHGVGSSGMVWNPHFEELAKMFETIYCVDLPGFGRVCTPENLLNQKTSLAYDALFVEFLSLYIDTVIPADSVCYLYGHSFGAHLALSYAAQYPKRISGLILAHPAGILPTLGKSGAYWGILFKLSPVQRILRSIGCLGLRFIAFWLHLLHQPFEAIYWLYVMFVIMHSHNTLSATRSLEGRTASEI